MAIMHPNINNPVLFATKSEELFYNALKSQLSKRYHVFYSVVWTVTKNGEKRIGECDFMIYHSDFGFLVIEVKGGNRIEVNDGWWTIYDGQGCSRELKRSPFAQAQDSMFTFKEYYEKEYNTKYKGSYGCGIAFPYYDIDDKLGIDAPKETIISRSDMNNLDKKINSMFHYWSGKLNHNIGLPIKQQTEFINLLNRRICINIAFDSIINSQSNYLSIINQIQDSYWDFLNHYNKCFIVGGAGTGKTWMAVKKANRLINDGKSVLLLCFNKTLSEFLKNVVDSGVDVSTFHAYIHRLIGATNYNKLSKDNIELNDVLSYIDFANIPKYDAIIIDEAQDFTEEWALLISEFLKQSTEPNLFVFYDKDQNIFSREFKTKFGISNPPFVLSHNVRNTDEIWGWNVARTGIGTEILTSGITGIEPEVKEFKTITKLITYIEKIISEFIIKEGISNSKLTILSDVKLEHSVLRDTDRLLKYEIKENKCFDLNDNEMNYCTVNSFKGMENDIIIFLNHGFATNMQNYVAYTRARFFLFEINCEKIK